MMATIMHWIAHYGYLALFGLLRLGIVGLPVPGETLLTFAGYLIFRGKFALLPTLAAAFFGSVCGMSLSYGLGRTLGRALVERLGHRLHLPPEGWTRWRRGTIAAVRMFSSLAIFSRPFGI
jgi:membrane protein DedA with SNARE-associated domain